MSYKNKEDQAICSKKHYEANKEVYLARAKANNIRVREKNREFIKSYLRTHPCVDCGNSDIRVLEFDHVRGKKDSCISTMSSNSYSIKRIKEEIDKCEVRCANCHRVVTYERRKHSLDLALGQ